ncbi:MAG: hypothetical protein COS34_01055 [Lysobacterales bacterium CG02_land_8_20_14_3_00_62_12]|nr:MAG: hypothetical protein COS34_01055 [Xanthomonadales bacterium CG02_land_8_20_14_3_00_62_12]
MRSGAVAALTVADFDARAKTRTIRCDKTDAAAGRKILLLQNVAELMREQARRKLPTAPLFSRWDGSA